MESWRPAVIFGVVGGGRSARNRLCASMNKLLRTSHDFFLYDRLKHAQLGGVTAARCQVMVWTRKDAGVRRESLMMAEEYSRSIQTALDDTVGADLEEPQLNEPRLGEVLPSHAVGFLNDAGRGRRPVYDGRGMAPDVSALPPDDRRVLVLTSSTFARGRVIRQIRHDELLRLWNYEGKLESRIDVGRCFTI